MEPKNYGKENFRAFCISSFSATQHGFSSRTIPRLALSIPLTTAPFAVKITSMPLNRFWHISTNDRLHVFHAAKSSMRYGGDPRDAGGMNRRPLSWNLARANGYVRLLRGASFIIFKRAQDLTTAYWHP